MRFLELDERVSLHDQMQAAKQPVVLINVLTVAPEEAQALQAAWEVDARVMQKQPGFVSTQLHRGIAGSSVFINYAVWQSAELFRAAFENPEFQAHLGEYPASTVVSPHLFEKVAIPGVCGG